MKYKLMTPVSDIPEDVLSKETPVAEDSSEDENKDEEDLSRPTRRVSYHRESPLFVQCYKLIHDAGPEGLYLQEVIRSLPVSHYIARRVPVTLENAGLIVSKLEDHHHHKLRKLLRRFKLTASCYLKGGRSTNLNFDTHKPKQPQKKKTPSSPQQSPATTTVSPSKPTHSRAPVIRQQQPQTPEHTDTLLDNSYQSDVVTEEPSQDSDLFDNQDETLSVSEYSDSDPSPTDNTPVAPLSQLKQERGGIVFTEEEIKSLVDQLTARFGALDTELKLSYVEPHMLPRKLASTTIYERRRADLIGYIQQRRVVTDRMSVMMFLTACDTAQGVKYRLDRRTISRLLSNIQTEGYIHQFQLEVTNEGVAQSDKVYMFHNELLTSARMVSKCEGLLIRLTDKISWAEPAYRGPLDNPAHRVFSPALPKFQKLRALHIYLYLLVYGADIDFDKISELPFSWLSKVHPLPDTAENGPGWINAAIALRCIPFSLFFALNARKKDYTELSEPILDILSDPTKRDLPKARINFDKLGTGEFRLKRRYGSRYREMLLQLYEIGVVEIEGTMPGAKRTVELNLNLETVYVYIKPKLTLIDTSRDSHGMRFSYFTNEAREYLPTYVIQLETVADLDYYWLMANMISNGSKISMDFDRRKKARKHEEFSLKPGRDKSNLRNLDLEGFSAAGFPPSLFSNNNRNWTGVLKPPDPTVCHFNYSCNSLAYRAKNVVAIDPNKTNKQFAVPTPKLLMSQRAFLVKSQRKSRERIVVKKARLKTVRYSSNNMVSFIRANYRAPSEAGRMRKPLTRCSHWTQEESKKLLLCYVASVSLMKLVERLVPTMVEIMSVIEESSKDKSTSPIRRHLRSLFKKTPMLHNYCDNSIQDVYTSLQSHDSSEYTFERVYEYTRLKLSDNPTAVLRGEFKENITLLPSSTRELQDNYVIKKFCAPIFKPFLLTEGHKHEDEIKLSMLQDMIVSTVSMYSECTFENYTAYLMYNKFSPPLLKKVLTTFRQNHVLIRNKAVGMRDMKYKFKYVLQSRITESYPISCLLEPQLIPYSLSDVPLYSDNPDSSDTLATTLTEDVMLVSPADFYSLLKHLHCHPNNFRLDIELPYKIRKLGDDPTCQFPLSVYERGIIPRDCESNQNVPHSVCMEQDENKFQCTSTSKYFGFKKTDVVKCSDIVTLAVSDAWSVVEFETRDQPSDFSCYAGSQGKVGEMTWDLYVKLVTEYLNYSPKDVADSEEILRIIRDQKVMGAPELDLIQDNLSCGESEFSRESLVQNLVNFRLVVRAGTVEACLIAREFSEAWTHPLLGLDSIQPSHVTQSKLDEQCITSFRPWIGLISSDLNWNKLILNQLTRSIHCYIVTNTGTSEISILSYYHGFCQLRHLRDILQSLVDSGYIRRVVLEEIGADTGYRKNTLFSKPKQYTVRQVSDLSNKDPTNIFYEGLPGIDVSGDQLMLQD